MSYLASGALAVSAGATIYGGIMAKRGADAQAAQANAAGAFSDFQNRLAGLQKLNQANQIMDQAKQQSTIIQTRALAQSGAVTAAQSASGAVGFVGSAANANALIEKGAATDVMATIGSAINKQTATVEEGMNNFTDATNAITRGAAQAASLEAAGSAAETGSILSAAGSLGTGLSKLGVFNSAPPGGADGYTMPNGESIPS